MPKSHTENRVFRYQLKGKQMPTSSMESNRKNGKGGMPKSALTLDKKRKGVRLYEIENLERTE